MNSQHSSCFCLLGANIKSVSNHIAKGLRLPASPGPGEPCGEHTVIHTDKAKTPGHERGTFASFVCGCLPLTKYKGGCPHHLSSIPHQSGHTETLAHTAQLDLSLPSFRTRGWSTVGGNRFLLYPNQSPLLAWEGSRQADGLVLVLRLLQLWGWLSCLPFQREPYGCFDSSHQKVSGDLEIWGWGFWGIFLGRDALPGTQLWDSIPLTAGTAESHRGYGAA